MRIHPAQIQGAYGLSTQIARGIDGRGVTVAVVDAYVSPTLLGDAREYSRRDQPSQVLGAGQFSEILSKSFNQAKLCEPSEWSGEQTLDVEAVHATAPGAHILYMGAKSCTTGLNKSVQQVVDGHLAQIITDSWGDNGGDVFDSAGSRRAFDNVLLMAAATGIGVQFSAGDNGDEFSTIVETVADYPPSSPYDTAVGGTSLVGKGNRRTGELGWSTSKSAPCTATLYAGEYPGCTQPLLGTWLPPAPGAYAYAYGGGGGTSLQYAEPWYQAGVVPAALAARNPAVTGIANRVVPDISMDGDPNTGMLVGETQEFPDGTYYDQYRIGGTSVSSPLFAGVMADADQAAGVALGFVNPAPLQARRLSEVRGERVLRRPARPGPGAGARGLPRRRRRQRRDHLRPHARIRRPRGLLRRSRNLRRTAGRAQRGARVRLHDRDRLARRRAARRTGEGAGKQPGYSRFTSGAHPAASVTGGEPLHSQGG